MFWTGKDWPSLMRGAMHASTHPQNQLSQKKTKIIPDKTLFPIYTHMHNLLPVFKCIINPAEDSPLEVQAVALVDQPAIERNFLAFKQQKPFFFAINEERQIISGPAMLANTPIYRKDADMGEYLVTFDKPTIQHIVEKFFSKGLMNAFNLMHQASAPVGGTCIFESFITDKTRGIQPMKGFDDVPDGSWFISAKVNNAGVWAKIKSGELKGFSVEGLFNMLPVKMNKQLADHGAADDVLQALTDEERIELIKQILNETE
jgi:hypothetical protein